MNSERNQAAPWPPPTSSATMRTVLTTVGALLLIVLVAETLAASYAPRRFAGGEVTLRYVPYIGHFSTMFVETLGQSSDGEQVWVLGGSALGGGDSGAMSLPSAFGKEAEKRGRSLSIRNMGQPGFNMNQTRILFEEMLLRQPPPSIAIFYVGGNETVTTVAAVGYPARYKHFRDRIERRLHPVELRSELAREQFRLPFLINYLFNRRVDPLESLAGRTPYNPFRAPGLAEATPDDHDLIAEAVADSFAGNVRLLEGTCSAFEVRCFFYWQPLLCFKKATTPYEAKVLAGHTRHGVGQSCLQARATEAAIRRHPYLSGNETFVNLSLIFAEVSGPIFEDVSHMDRDPAHGFVGNRILGWRLYSDIFPD